MHKIKIHLKAGVRFRIFWAMFHERIWIIKCDRQCDEYYDSSVVSGTCIINTLHGIDSIRWSNNRIRLNDRNMSLLMPTWLQELACDRNSASIGMHIKQSAGQDRERRYSVFFSWEANLELSTALMISTRRQKIDMNMSGPFPPFSVHVSGFTMFLYIVNLTIRHCAKLKRKQ